jgi:UDP-N-acetylmuramoyl-L-alanyl-D-glutamate--2,6-diaminopimelate ligase
LVKPQVPLPDAARAIPHARLGGVDQDGAVPLVRGLTLASGEVAPGDLFAALPGAKTHGARYAAAALAAGGVGVLTDPAGEALLEPDTPRLVVPDPRAVLGGFAAWLYGFPAARLKLVGITGTNGKTTVAHLVESALAQTFSQVALLGTIVTRLDGEEMASVRTTLEAPALQAAFAAMVERGIEACVMEVSSHALELHRVDGFRFDVAAFTNLSRDHLDFHGSMEQYFAAKAALFTPGHARLGVINVGDRWAARLAAEATIPCETIAPLAPPIPDLTGAAPDWTVLQSALGAPAMSGGGDALGTSSCGDTLGTSSRRDARGAPGTSRRLGGPGTPGAPGIAGTPFTLSGPGGLRVTSRTALPGAINLENAALALVTAIAAGVDPDAAGRGIAAARPVPGRMERIAGPPGAPTVIVDYAHSPRSVAAALAALRPATKGRLIAVLGAGGDRDLGKREEMGQAAAAHADLVYITDDNPRSEDPASIRAGLLAGAGPKAREVADRGDGIVQAINEAREQDTVVILGKGHEVAIDYGGVPRPHSDATVAGLALRRKMEGSQ